MTAPKGAHALAQEQCDALQQELNGLGAQMAMARAGLVMQQRALDQAERDYANLEPQIVTRMSAVSERLSALQGLASQMPVDVPAPIPDTPAEVSQPHPETPHE